MTLEDLLRKAGESGAIETLSIYGPKAPRNLYQANFKRHGGTGWRVAHSEDPVEALTQVLSDFADDKPDNGDIFG